MSGDAVRRLPARAIEQVVSETAKRWLGSEERALDQVRSVRLSNGALIIELATSSADLLLRLEPGERMFQQSGSSTTLHLPVAMPLRGGRRHIVTGLRTSVRPEASLIGALRKAHRMLAIERGMPLVEAAPW